MKRRCRFLMVSFMFVCSLLLAAYSCYVKYEEYEECFYSIQEEVVLISEFGVVRDSDNNDLGVGVISFKVGDILYGIGHYSNLPEDSSLSVYKVIDKEILPSTKDNIEIGVNNINEEDFIGEIIEDTDNGMLISTDQLDTKQYSTISVAKEIFQGNAKLLMRDEEGKLQSYDISVKIASNFFDGKYLEISIKDEKLLAKAGGIISGMSGSPIIQNGKIIGIVTDVYLKHPERGRGRIIWNVNCIQKNTENN